MRKYVYAINLFIIIIFTLIPVAFAEAQDSSGEISYIEGTCLIQKAPDRDFKKAEVGQAVLSSDRIKTLPGSKAEIFFPDGSTILITEDSEITVQRSSLEQHTYTSIGLLFGSITRISKNHSSLKERKNCLFSNEYAMNT